MKRILLAVGLFTGLVLGSTLVNTPYSISPERSVRAESAISLERTARAESASKSVMALGQQFVVDLAEDQAACDAAGAGAYVMCRALGGSELACEVQSLCANINCMRGKGHQIQAASCPEN